MFKPANQGSYLELTAPTVQPDPNGHRFATCPLVADPQDKPLFESGGIVMRPSLPWKIIAARDAQQLLDLTTMLVARPDSTLDGDKNIEDDDWAASLARRVADAVDPAARLLSVLDETIAHQLDPSEPDGAKLRECLINDNGKNLPRLLTALNSIAWSVAGPRVAASPMTLPPSVIMLDALADGDTTRWPDTISHVLAHAARAAGTPQTMPDPSYFTLLPLRRIGAAVGLPGDPANLGNPVGEGAIDDEKGLLDFAARHWLGGDTGKERLKVAANGKIDLAARWRAAASDQPAIDPPSSPAPLLDIRRIFAGSDVKFDVSLKIPATDFSLVIAFVRAAGTVVANIKLGATATDATIRISVEQAGIQSAGIDIARADELTLTLGMAFDKGPPAAVTLSAGVGQTSTSLAATALLAEPVYVSVSATGSDVEFSVPASDLTQTATRKAFDRTATAPGLRAEPQPCVRRSVFSGTFGRARDLECSATAG
ncbi:hypothetical protein [Bradyrhizobium diazoefficiens]|uniref:hypothetical protein n=1 Tax=Bradyrhizobium diazoefficiens TaxID=1355477 RepID=UPI0035162102